MADATELMTRYCDGDPQALRDLYVLLAPQLAAPPEVLQRVFLAVHRARRAYVRGASPIPWIEAIARRVAAER